MGEKRHVTDFALWKFSPPDRKRQMEWDSPWGVGFPGWHRMLGHVGQVSGNVFRHSWRRKITSPCITNEMAQTQARFGTRLANFWLHGYFLQMEEARMSKSAGDFVRLQTLIDRGYDPIAYRFYCLSAHYRARLNFTWRGLDGAAAALNRLRVQAYAWGEAGTIDEEYADRFAAQVNDDLNLPRALAVVWDLVKSDLPDSTKKAPHSSIACWDWAWPVAIGNDVPKNLLFVQQRQKHAGQTMAVGRSVARADQRSRL
jgi:cysteinyl-tRNA synthetase